MTPTHSCRAYKRVFKRSALRQLILIAALPIAGQAQALSFTPSDDVKIDWDTTLTYGAMYRLQDQHQALIANINGDDGNRNFDKGIASNRFSFTTEADISYKRDYGLFLRARGWYDEAYQGSNDNDSNTFNNRSVAGDEFNRETRKAHGERAEFLDAFVYGGFDIGDNRANLRVGDQVVSWGESLFLQGGISSSMGPLDATKANVPGVELKDIFLPTGQVYFQTDLPGNFSAGAYYQYDWARTRIDEGGSYFGKDDLLDKGGETILAATGLGGFGLPAFMTIDRTTDNTPRDDGQFGVALRYTAEQLNDTEFGVYYTRSHDKNPMVKTRFATGGNADFNWAPLAGLIGPGPTALLQAVENTSYYLDYAEDIDLYGLSVSGMIGDTNVAGEFSYRQGAPVQVTTTDPTMLLGFDYALANIAQAQVSALHIFGPSALADSATFTGEVGVNRVQGIDSARLYNDKSAWGYTAQLKLDYFNVVPGVDLSIPLTLKQGVNGNSSMAGTFTQGADSFAIGADATYLLNTRFGISYVNYFGNAGENALVDRDFISMNIKYTF